jgi:hypothetical protein
VTTVTGMHAWSESQRVLADAHGNNVAFACLNCGGPVLATLMLHQRGSSEENPTECRVCNAKFWVEPQVARNRLLVHRSKTPESGRYVAGRSPVHTAGQNIASWNVIAALLSAYGGAEYDELVAAVRQHDHPAGGKGFIDYCVRNGWLKRA